MFTVGSIGFGGGSALIPVMESELVAKRRFLDEPTFTTHTIVANITPGALPVKLAALAGERLGGPLYALLSAFTVALPGTLGTVGLLALIGTAAGAAQLIEFAAIGITAFIIVLLGLYVVRVLGTAGARTTAYVAIFVAAFIATGLGAALSLVGVLFGQRWEITVPRLSALGLILVAIAAIGIVSLFRRGSTTDAQPPPSAMSRSTWLSAGTFLAVSAVAVLVASLVVGPRLLETLGLVAFSTVSSFGGGEAYVAVADGFFVQPGLVSSDAFFGQLVPIANALPGPILVKIATGIGMMVGGGAGGTMGATLGAVAAFVLSIGACCALALGFMAGFDRAARWPFVVALRAYILPVICGLLATTAVQMVLASVTIGSRASVSAPVIGWASIGAVAVLWWLHRRYGWHDLVLLGAAGVVSLGAMMAVVGI